MCPLSLRQVEVDRIRCMNYQGCKYTEQLHIELQQGKFGVGRGTHKKWLVRSNLVSGTSPVFSRDVRPCLVPAEYGLARRSMNIEPLVEFVAEHGSADVETLSYINP